MKAIVIIKQEFSQIKGNLKNQNVQIFETEQQAQEELKRVKKTLKQTPSFRITIDASGILSFENLIVKYNYIITKL